MNLREIQLTAAESNWRLFMIRKADKAFLSFQDKVFQRDQYSCQYCGFTSKQHMEVVNIDRNYRNNNIGNLVTACPFCAQCFFLDAVGKGDFGGGTLIYLPEMSQTDLNAMCHVLFNAIVLGGKAHRKAKNAYRSLKLRVQHVEKELGEGLSNPGVYGQVLIDVNSDKKHHVHGELVKKIRLLPNMARYVNQIASWADEGLRLLK
ncbi:MAG: type IVB secretion system protein IcmJDotN [Gammaproteobacteria bacterium]|nr:type IVB secretion system protein IcmJDotN [Gammaproteobacteria bacterium]MCH9744090.1 type IVB secretion system protein IcmJDotN [Gammaproteobacteria bacterium]